MVPLPMPFAHTYWESTEAIKMFCPLPTERDSSEAVDNQIMLLSEASSYPEAYVDVVHMGQNGGSEDDEKLSDHQTWLVRQKEAGTCSRTIRNW